MNKKSIAVIGPVPRDHITTYQGEVIEKYGCITHPVIALSKLTEGKAEIYPISHLRKKDAPRIKELFEKYEGIDVKGLKSELDQGDTIILRFLDQNKRIEKQTGFMNPVIAGDLADFTHCDVFVFLPVTDYEISLDTLKYIKENSDGVVIFDAHGPTTSVSIFGDRTMKFWVDRDQWLPYIDVLKMNMEEAYCSWFKNEYEIDEMKVIRELSREELNKFAAYCISKGVKAILVTMDSRGCMVYYKKDEKFVEELIPPVKVDSIVDTTGCGDSFAGGIAFGLLNDHDDYIKAAKYANALGAQRTQGRDFEVFKSLQETNNQLLETYSKI